MVANPSVWAIVLLLLHPLKLSFDQVSFTAATVNSQSSFANCAGICLWFECLQPEHHQQNIYRSERRPGCRPPQGVRYTLLQFYLCGCDRFYRCSGSKVWGHGKRETISTCPDIIYSKASFGVEPVSLGFAILPGQKPGNPHSTQSRFVPSPMALSKTVIENGFCPGNNGGKLLFSS